MKPRRRDIRAEESLIPVFLMAAVFITTSAMLISYMSPTLRSNAGTWQTDIGYEVIGGRTYNTFDPTGGYNVTIADAATTWDHDADTNLYFDGSTYGYDDNITVAIIRDSEEVADFEIGLDPINILPWNPIGVQLDIGYGQENLFYDYFMVFREFPLSLYTWESSAEIALPFEWVYACHSPNSNQSVVDFMLRNDNYSLVVTTPGPADTFEALVEENIFTVQLAVSSADLAAAAEGGFWNTVGQLATAQLPQTHWVVNTILAVMFWTPLGFAIVEFFRRFVPLLG